MPKNAKQGPNAKVIIEGLPEDVTNEIAQAWLTKDERDASIIASPHFFKHTSSGLCHAIFTGEKKIVKALVDHDPEALFKPGEFRMPLMNADGTKSKHSEFVIYGTPFAIALYTGDFRTWDAFFPLIPDHRLEFAIEVMKQMHPSQGRSDLVKINWDPRPFLNDKVRLIEKLKFHQGGADENCNPIVYDMLCNPDGIVCYVDGETHLFFYVNKKTNEVEQLIPSNKALFENKVTFEGFTQFIDFIDNELANNSGARLKNEWHKLVKDVFNKNLERHGLHYQIWNSRTNETTHYQDVCDGGIRLMNGYRKYLEVYSAHDPNTPWDAVDKAWVDCIPHRLKMPHFNHLLCEKASYPSNKEALKSLALSDCDEYSNRDTGKYENIYPLALDKCALSFMSIESGSTIKTDSLEKKTYLIRSGDKYHIWGYKNNTWRLTPIDSSKIPAAWKEASWENGRTELISSDHIFFNSLKEGVSGISSLGFSIGLHKGWSLCGPFAGSAGREVNQTRVAAMTGWRDLVAVCQTVEVSNERFNERLHELEERLRLSAGSGHSLK